MRYSVDKCLAIIQKYRGRMSVLSAEESAELDEAYASIEYSQNNCYHKWAEVTIFTYKHEECDYCGKKKGSN